MWFYVYIVVVILTMKVYLDAIRYWFGGRVRYSDIFRMVTISCIPVINVILFFVFTQELIENGVYCKNVTKKIKMFLDSEVKWLSKNK